MTAVVALPNSLQCFARLSKNTEDRHRLSTPCSRLRFGSSSSRIPSKPARAWAIDHRALRSGGDLRTAQNLNQPDNPKRIAGPLAPIHDAVTWVWLRRLLELSNRVKRLDCAPTCPLSPFGLGREACFLLLPKTNADYCPAQPYCLEPF